MMIFDLSQLGRPGRPGEHDEHVERTFPPSAFEPQDEDYRGVAPASLVMDLHKDADVVRVSGRVRTTLELDCGRCLEPFAMPVDSTFDLRYVPQHANAQDEEESEVAEDDLTTAFYSEDRLDLGELMREQFQLALPMKPLCRADCRGLCAQCGTNLNRGTCDCHPHWDDPRLAPLKGLLNREKEN
jgi:uncharacterized protein